MTNFRFPFIRILSLLEIAQYSLIVIVLTFLICYGINMMVISILKKRKRTKRKNLLDSETKLDIKPSFIFNFLYLFLSILFIIVVIIYIQKFALLIPSISRLLNTSFDSHKHTEHIFHVALFIAFVEFLPHFKKLFSNINRSLMSESDIELLYKGE
jgi:H+/gluconate symporter-like permease